LKSSVNDAASTPWWVLDGGLKFSCLPGCRRCCGGAPGDVWLTAKEQAEIAARLNLSLKAFHAAYTRKYASGRISLREQSNGDCILLGANGCSVYENRPGQCRSYPFWPEIIESRRCWHREKKNCPGIGQGRPYAPDEIQALLDGRKEST
jgi:hypothetical protein